MMQKIKVAQRSTLASGKSKTFRCLGQSGIVWNDGGVLRAYVNRCTHMGGPTQLVGGRVLRCDWHQAEFNACTGEAIEGEAPKGTRLPALPIVEEGDDIYVIWEIKEDEF